MALDLIPRKVHDGYRFQERRHACAILATDFPEEWKDVLRCLDHFTLRRSDILKKGGRGCPELAEAGCRRHKKSRIGILPEGKEVLRSKNVSLRCLSWLSDPARKVRHRAKRGLPNVPHDGHGAVGSNPNEAHM